MINQHVDKNRIFIILPWTYGVDDNGYKSEIEKLLIDHYDYVFLTKRLSDEEIVALRMVTDVLIEVQKTDALNATMLETMYANGDVITGSWLQYQDIYDRGVKMYQVDSVGEVGAALNGLLENPSSRDDKQNNKRIIRELYLWRNFVEEWVKLYL